MCSNDEGEQVSNKANQATDLISFDEKIADEYTSIRLVRLIFLRLQFYNSGRCDEQYGVQMGILDSLWCTEKTLTLTHLTTRERLEYLRGKVTY